MSKVDKLKKCPHCGSKLEGRGIRWCTGDKLKKNRACYLQYPLSDY